MSSPKLLALAPLLSGLVGLAGCATEDELDQAQEKVDFRNDDGPVSCSGLACTQEGSSLGHWIDQSVTWDPCNGGAFSFALNANFERRFDHVQVGGTWYTGSISVNADVNGPTTVRIRTDYSVSSRGIQSLTATCADGSGGGSGGGSGTTTTTGGSDTGGGGGGGGGPTVSDGALTCSGLSCSNPGGLLPNRENARVTWDPCNGGGFDYSGLAIFESRYDYLYVDGRGYTGRRSINGSASGPIQVRISTDFSVRSPGIQSLTATCHGGSSTGTTTTSTSTTSTTGTTTGGDTSTDDTSTDDTTGTANLVCSAAGCITPNPPLGHNLDESVTWNPCNGGSFRYTADISFENRYDFIDIGASTLTGNRVVEGQAAGPIAVRIRTDHSVSSRGIRSLTAQCDGDTGTTTTTTTTGDDSTTTGDDSTTTGDTTGTDDTSTDDTTPSLDCTGLSCTSSPNPLPANQNLSFANWDPCAGQPFSVQGSIAINENVGQPTRDQFILGNFVFTGSRSVQADLPGPVSMSLITVDAGADVSQGIESLTATCDLANYGLSCEGLSCQTGADLLPGMMNQTVSWNPCDNGPFTWTLTVNTEASSDFVIVDGQAVSGPSQSASGSATGAINVTVQTDRFGDSVGIETLTATCGDVVEPPPFPGRMMSDWSAAEVAAYNTTVADFIEDRGIMMLNMHANWHATNDTGANADGNGGVSGNQGPGSGMAFMGMHRRMMNMFRMFAMASSDRVYALPANTVAALPAGLDDAQPSIARLPAQAASWYIPRTRTSYAGSGVGVPNFFVIGGNGFGSGAGATYRLKGDRGNGRANQVIRALEDFANPDEIGEAMGLSGYHGRGHFWIGGTMGTVHSPADPVFWGWHRLIDDIMQNWLDNTPNGRAWTAANPSHPILSRTDMEMMPFANRNAALGHGGI